MATNGMQEWDMDVWLLWHIPPDAADTPDGMLIGVYSSQDAALAAVQRLAGQPGFADHPGLTENTDQAGFLVEPYPLDKDHWTEGVRAESG